MLFSSDSDGDGVGDVCDPTPDPPASSPLFADYFESGDMSKWTTNNGLIVQSQQVYGGSYAARATTTGPARYAIKQLASPKLWVSYRLRFKLISRGSASPVMLARLRYGRERAPARR